MWAGETKVFSSAVASSTLSRNSPTVEASARRVCSESARSSSSERSFVGSICFFFPTRQKRRGKRTSVCDALLFLLRGGCNSVKALCRAGELAQHHEVSGLNQLDEANFVRCGACGNSYRAKIFACSAFALHSIRHQHIAEKVPRAVDSVHRPRMR